MKEIEGRDLDHWPNSTRRKESEMKRGISVVLLALTLCAGAPASASTFLAMSQEELVLNADAVIDGRIVYVDSFWDEKNTVILSEAMVEVDEIMLGEAPAAVILRTVGGQVGDYIVEAPGFPKFHEGERVLVFLTRVGDGSFRVLGHGQGHFHIRADEDGTEVAVPSPMSGARLLNREGKSVPGPETMSLDVFKAQLRAGASRGQSTQE